MFTQKIYPEIDPKHESAIKQRMRKLMFGQTTRHNERTTILISLAFHTDLLKQNFDRERLKRNKDRIKKIVAGDMYSARATKAAVEAMQVAILMIATMAATIHSG